MSLTVTKGYDQIAGNLALDFVNTLGGNRHGQTREYLTSFEDFARWAELVGILSKPKRKALVEHADENQPLANEVMARGLALREATYRAVVGKASAEDLFLVSREATFAMGRAKITAHKKGFSWDWPDNADLDRLLWPVARAAAELLTSADMALVRECASETCTWVFLDTSKNHRRRWCDMKDCGNRAKVRRHRQA